MDAIFILLLTFVTPVEISSIALRNENLIENATFENLSDCERALASYASQTDPIMIVTPNDLGQLEAYTSLNSQSKGKVSCLRVILPADQNLPLS